MNATTEKIIFVLVMVAVTTFGSHSGLADVRQGGVQISASKTEAAKAASEAPIFVLSSPIVSHAADSSSRGLDAEAARDVIAQDGGATTQTSDAVLEPDAQPQPEPTDSSNVSQKATLSSEQTIRPAVYRPVGTVTDPAVQAEAAFLADLQTGETYVDLRSRRRWPIASITKLMTAAVVYDTMNATDTITLTDADFPLEDTSVGKRLKPGESYTVSDLLSAMLIVSSNEAAEALAQHADRAAFLTMMNGKAAAWGMADTYFADPTGLSSANQSTARDLSALALRISSEYPQIFEATRTQKKTITDLAAKKKQILQNINQFAGETWFVGGKTGYTDDAQGNLLTVFSHSHRPVIVIVLGTADRFGESERLIDWFSDNYKLTSVR